MIDVVTDLLGKRVTVSMWLTNGPGNRDAQGEMVRLITGVVRALGAHSDCFMVLVQTEIAHRGTRKVGALTMFSISPRGGVEVVPEPDTHGLERYRALQVKLRAAQSLGEEALQREYLDDMRKLWGTLASQEKEALVTLDESSSPGMLQYRGLEVRLRKARADKATEDQEVVILDDMEQLWWKLSQDERDVLDREGPTCDPPKKP